jgi:hypothetical protein
MSGYDNLPQHESKTTDRVAFASSAAMITRQRASCVSQLSCRSSVTVAKDGVLPEFGTMYPLT